MINISDFETIKNNGVEYYKSLTDVYCPYFQERIAFNSKGLEHLKFRRFEKPRTPEDQYMRFKLLHLAPQIISSSNTLQGIFETKGFEKVHIHSRTETVLKPVSYFEFIAVIKRDRVKIIIKQIDYGEKFFWSLIPYWKMNKITMSRILHGGLPEES